jgi:hypothetical protein
MTTTSDCGPIASGTAPDIRPPAGHALLTERHGTETLARCQCGEPLGSATSPDSAGLAWAQHMAEVS